MIHIKESDIIKLNLTSQDYIEWVDKALETKKNCILPAKISMKQEGHKFFNVMPCIIPELRVAGVKVVTRYPERKPSLKSDLMLYDNNSGEMKAIVDADYITTWRTAAVAVHSINLLAKKNYETIAFLGLGVIGKATLKVYIETVGGKNVEIRLLNYKNRAGDIVREYGNRKGIKFVIYDSYEEMIDGCDVIVSAVTYAEKDFCDESLHKKGCMPVTTHTLGFQGCDLTFDKIFGDDKAHIEGFKYFDKFKEFHEIAEVLNGVCKGRESDDERIIAYNIGIALHDITFANEIYNRAVNAGI